MVVGHAWQRGVHGWGGMCGSGQILRDTVNERVVRILLECILVFFMFCYLFQKHLNNYFQWKFGSSM